MFISKSILIIIGSVLESIGINFFLLPYDILDGGIIGISMIAHYLFGIKIGLSVIVLNIPIYVFAWFYFRHYFYRSVHGMIVSSFFIDLLAPIAVFKDYFELFTLTPLECSILGGMFIGSGVGLMLRHRTSTEGTELIALSISRRMPINEGIILFVFDIIPICLAEILIPSSHFFLSLITSCSVGVMTSLYTFRLEEHAG
jgi:uncharacterized membrane-anchored protein YitT (DUF2179 family)